MRFGKVFLHVLPLLCASALFGAAPLPLTVLAPTPASPVAGQLVSLPVRLPVAGALTGITITVTPPAGNGNPVAFPATINAALNSGLGNRPVTFTLPQSLATSATIVGATFTVQGTVGPDSYTGSVVVNISPPPLISNVSPGAGAVGSTVIVSVKLQNTAWNPVPAGLVALNFTLPGNTSFPGTVTGFVGQTITATVNIPAGATPGSYTVCATFGVSVCSVGGFIVTATPALTFSSIAPNVAAQCGTGIPIAVTGVGTHFLSGAGPSANFGDGITVNSVLPTSNTTATASITVDCLAPVGPRTVTFVTGGEFAVATNGFTVSSGTAKVGSALPATGAQGSNLSVALAGVGTHWALGSGGTSVNFGPGINVGNVAVSGTGALTASISISPTADLGFRSITTITNGEIASLANGFTVTPVAAPKIVSVSSTTAPQGTGALTLTVNTSGTTFLASPPTFDFGPNITTTVAPILSNTSATVTLGIAPTAAVGPRTVILSSGGLNLSFNFTVTASGATITSVTPGVLVSGSSFSLTVTGAGTNWAQGVTTASFSGGTVNRVTITPPSSAVVDVTIPQSSRGNASFSMTTGGEVATLTGGLTITGCAPSLALTPSSAQVGNATLVTLTTSCLPIAPGAFATIDGQGVSVGALALGGPATATSTFTVSATAPATPAQQCSNRVVTLTNPGTPAQVLTAPFCVTSTPAVLTSVAPNHASSGNPVSLKFFGSHTNFDANTTTVSFGPNITALSAKPYNVTPTQFGFDILVLPNAATGWRTAYVNTGAEQVQIPFFIDPPGSGAAVSSLVSIVPSSAAQGQSLVTVTITGNGTNFDTDTIPYLGPGITVGKWSRTTGTLGTAVIAVDPRTPVGPRGVEMVTASTGEDVTGLSFTVTPGIASIASPAPGPTQLILTQGQIAPFSITGANTNFLAGATTVDFGPGITVTSLTVVNSFLVTGQLSVSNSSPTGLRSVTATTLGETATSFTDAVLVNITAPSGMTITPTSAQQGTTLNVQVQGIGTNWAPGVTTASFGSNNGLTITGLTVNAATQQATFTLTVDGKAYITQPFAPPLPYDLTMTTQVGATVSKDVLKNAFSIARGAAIITSVTPSVGKQSSTVSVSIVGQNTNFVNGVTQAMMVQGSCLSSWSLQPDVNVANVTVSSLTTATLSVAIGPDAPTGLRSLCLFTQGEIAVFANAFTVLPGTPTLNSVSPVSAQQGQTLNLTLTGQFSNFGVNSTITYGAGIVPQGPVVKNPGQSLSQLVRVDPLAYTGGRTVTVTTGSEIVSANLFSVTPGGAIITDVSPSSASAGTQNLFLTITGSGTHWAQGETQFQLTGDGITINGMQTTAVSAVVDISIAPNATPGVRSIYMATEGETLSKIGSFVVTGGIPAITCISPRTLVQGQNAVNMQLCGTLTNWTQATTKLTTDSDLTIASATVNSNTAITTVLNVKPTATTGLHTITVQTGAQILNVKFYVDAAPTPAAPTVPFIQYQTANGALVGQTLDVSFQGNGTKWQSNLGATPTTIAFGLGIAVNSFQVTGSTTAVANITIAPTAGVGTRTVTFTTGASTQTTTFSVKVGTPVLSLIDPATILQGQTRAFEVVGQFTTFKPGTVFAACPGVAVIPGVPPAGSTAATITLSASSLAQVGTCSISATTGTEVATGAITISPGTATITNVTPNTQLQGNVVAVTLNGFRTNWGAGTAFDFGPGIAVVVNAVAQATASLTLTLDPLATIGNRTVTATTGGEVATIANGFVVQPGTPILLSVTPVSAPQQGSFTMGVLGQFTAFNPLWRVDIGAAGNGVGTVNPPASVSAGAISVNGSVGAIAPLGLRDVVVSLTVAPFTTLTLPNAFRVTVGPAALSVTAPVNAKQGDNGVVINVFGANTNFNLAPPTVDFGPGSTVTKTVVISATHLQATVNFAPLSTIGKHDITVVTGGETALGQGLFTVVANTPVVTFVNPNSGRQGETLNILVTGFNFTPALPVTFSGGGITVNSVTPIDATHAAFNITIDPTTPVGPRDITVAGVTRVGGFAVTSEAGTGGTFLYTSNADKKFAAFITDKVSGALTALTDAPYSNGANVPKTLVFSTSGQFAYAPDPTTSTVSMFNMDAGSGTLSTVPGSPFALGVPGKNIVFHPTAAFAYVVTSTGNVLVSAVDPITGIPGTPAAGVAGTGIAFSPDGLYAWVLNGNTVVPYTVNTATGALTANGAALPVGTSPTAIAVSASGSLLYVANGVSNNVSAFRVSAGALTFVGNYATSAGPQSLAILPSESFLYTASNGPAGGVTGFSIDKTTGALTSVGNAGILTPMESVVSDPAGTHLYASSASAGTLAGYSIGTPGTLSSVATPYVVGNGPASVSVGVVGSVLNGIYPSSGLPGNLDITVVGHNTHFKAGLTTLDLGPGIVVSNIRDVNPTFLRATLTLSAAGPFTNRNLTVTTNGEVAHALRASGLKANAASSAPNEVQLLANAFNLLAPPATLTQISPNSVVAGSSNVNITITGQYSNFTSGVSAVNLGSGITVNSIAVNSSTSVTVNITVGAAAPGTASISVTDATDGTVTANLPFTVVPAVKTLSVSPSSVSFPTTNVAATAAAIAVTVTNTGNAPVTFGTSTFSGPHTGDFAATRTCGATLAVSASCNISFTFTPGLAGPRTATYNLLSDASASPQAILLNGIGRNVVRTLSFNVSNLNFGTLNTGTASSAQAVTVTNTGNVPVNITAVTLAGANPSEFGIGTNNCSTLAVGAACTVSVTFTPIANGSRSTNLQFADDATGNPHSVLLTGTGQSATQNLTFSPATLVYTVVTVGSQSTSGVQIQNVGTAPVAVSGVQITGPAASDFSVVSNNCTTLTQNAACSVAITFSASAAGPRAANVQINDNAPGSPHNVPLLGTGQTATQVISQSTTDVVFAATPVGGTATGSFTLSSLGTGSATLAAPVLAGANPGDFGITGNSCPVGAFASGVSCTVTVSFHPTASGVRTATITVNDNTPQGSHVVTLTGTGATITRILSFSPASLTFPVTLVGATSNLGITATSLGTGPVTFSGTAISGSAAADFSVYQNNCSGPIAPSASCGTYVAFTPTAAGVRTAVLTLQDDATGGPHAIQLVGTAAAVTQIVSQSTTNLTFPSTNVGVAATASFTLTNLGTGPVNFTSTALAGTNAGDFSVSQNTCNTALYPTGACTVFVAFTPAAAGIRTATVTVADGSGSHVVQLTGTAQAVTKTLSFYPGTTTFGSVTVGNSTNSSFSVYNLGTATATISSYSVGGTNASDFTVYQNGCPMAPATLLPGGSCGIAVNFAPSAPGIRTATVTLTDDAAGSPQVVTLVGYGQAAVQTLSFSAATLDLGVQPIGYTSGVYSVLVTNNGVAPVSITATAITGANAVDFAITQNGCPRSLTPATSCYVSVSFTPSAAGARSAMLQFTDSAPDSPHAVALSGLGEAVVQTISVAPQTLVFPAQSLNTGSQAVFSIATNTGDAPVTFSGASIIGTDASDFAITANSCTATPQVVGGTCAVFVQFTPTKLGIRTATLQLASNAADSPVSLALFGTGVPAVSSLVFSPGSFDFGTMVSGTTRSPLNFSIANNGSTPVNITGISLVGPNASEFTLGTPSCPSTLAPGGVCFQTVGFAPTGLGQKVAALQIAGDGAGNPYLAGVTGLGAQSTQVIAMSAVALDFGILNAGATSIQQTLNLTNTGTATTSFTGFAIGGANPGDFAIVNNQCSATLVPGAQCSIALNFTPSGPGVRSASFQIADTASGSPQTVLLSGSGQTASKVLAMTTPALSFSGQLVGVASSGIAAFVLSNGTVPVSFSGYTITGTNGSDFAISLNQCHVGYADRLPAGSSCYVQIVFTPSGTGVRSATLTFADDAAGGTHTVSLSGYGLDSSVAGRSLVVTTPALAFPAVNVASTLAGQYAYVASTGPAPVTFAGYTITGTNASDFAIFSNGCTLYSLDKLAPSNSCWVQISFTPSAAGVRTAILNFASDAGGSPHTVVLTGVGQDGSAAGKMLVVATPALAFGNQNLGTSASGQYIYLNSVGTAPVAFTGYSITGGNASDFTITANNCQSGYNNRLPQNASCWVQVAFTPSASGVRSAGLAITDDALGGSHTVALSGVGQDASAATKNLVVTTPFLAFGAQVDGISAIQTVSVSSIGIALVVFSSYTVTGVNAADFAITYNNCHTGYLDQLSQGSSCQLQITFTPSSPGVRTATLNFADDAGGSPHTVSLSGVGQDSTVTGKSLVVATPVLAFGAQNIATTSGSQSMYVTSTGTAPVTFSSYTITGANAADFTVSSSYCRSAYNDRLPANTGCYVSVTFTPSAEGVRSATLNFNDDSTGSPHTALLTGYGQVVTTTLVATTSSIAFPAQTVGTTSSLGITYVQNTGTGPVSFTAYTFAGPNAGDFRIVSNQCHDGYTDRLTPGNACSVGIAFSPTAVGTRTATLQFTTNAVGSPQTVTLSGVGQ